MFLNKQYNSFTLTTNPSYFTWQVANFQHILDCFLEKNIIFFVDFYFTWRSHKVSTHFRSFSEQNTIDFGGQLIYFILPDEVTKFPDVFLAEASGVRALSGGRHEIGDIAVAGWSGAQKRTEKTKFNITFNRTTQQRSEKKQNNNN